VEYTLYVPWKQCVNTNNNNNNNNNNTVIADCEHQNIFGKSKGNVHLRTGRKGPEGEQMYTSTLSVTSALDGGG
jgi:hypothetical protein